jgi:lipid A ethanolaminephosphotransferase
MFSQAGREGFDGKTVRNTENILDVLKRAGVSVFWLDNNSSSKNVADRVTFVDFKTAENNPHCDIECRDTGMLPATRKLIDQTPGDVLIVLHQMGSHGPAYFKRYPKAFERFKPACQSATLSDCDKQGIINAYDNTILYTDHFLAETIKLLKEYDQSRQTMMLYVSDHGESLGEKGIYLHGAPFMMAPKAQIHVPLFIWQGPLNAVDRQSLLERAALPQSHDALFPSLMNFYQVESILTQPDAGLFKVNQAR